MGSEKTKQVRQEVIRGVKVRDQNSGQGQVRYTVNSGVKVRPEQMLRTGKIHSKQWCQGQTRTNVEDM